MQSELSIIGLIINADIVVQMVMLILVIASLVSWTIIFNKKSVFIKQHNEINSFNKRFDGNKSVESCYTPNSRCFLTAGLNEAKKELNHSNGIEIAYRKINLNFNNKINKLEKNLSSLAIIASSSPYIGLFGTVWGIMHSFLSLASVKQATIAVVAPGIAEALIATAFGLFAAIPANIFYNKLTTELEEIHAKYQNIAEQFLIVMQRDSLK